MSLPSGDHCSQLPSACPVVTGAAATLISPGHFAGAEPTCTAEDCCFSTVAKALPSAVTVMSAYSFRSLVTFCIAPEGYGRNLIRLRKFISAERHCRNMPLASGSQAIPSIKKGRGNDFTNAPLTEKTRTELKLPLDKLY